MVNMEYHSFPLSCRHVSAVVLDWRGKEHKLISYQFYCSRKLLISGQLTQIHLVVRLIHLHHHLLHLCSLSCSYFRLSSHCHRRVFWSWKFCTRSTTCCLVIHLLSTHNMTMITHNSVKNRFTFSVNGGSLCTVPSGIESTKNFTMNFLPTRHVFTFSRDYVPLATNGIVMWWRCFRWVDVADFKLTKLNEWIKIKENLDLLWFSCDFYGAQLR